MLAVIFLLSVLAVDVIEYVVEASETSSGSEPAMAAETNIVPGSPDTEISLIAPTTKLTVWIALSPSCSC